MRQNSQCGCKIIFHLHKLAIKIAKLITIIVILTYTSFCLASLDNFCAVPPFITRSVPPNILVVIDVSGSMQFPAYLPCNWHGYDNKVAQCGISSNPNYSYNSSIEYYGYFDTDKYYKYESNKFLVNDNCEEMEPDCIPGNLLNWVTMSRIDILRKVLIGGKSVSQQSNTHTLRGEGGDWTFIDNNLHCKFEVSGGQYPNLAHKLTISNYSGNCAVGTLSNAQIKVDVPSRQRRGIVQEVGDRDFDNQWDENAPRFGLMIFASDDRYGCMRAGIGTSTLPDFLNAVQSASPYWGTPTGEALHNALDYYEQDHFEYYCPGNEAYISKEKDPWQYWCQKSFILLISDGEWNGAVDPVVPAREGRIGIHERRAYDLRSDLKGSQTVITYTVYAFSDSEKGKNAMQQVAIYGGFEDICDSGDGKYWPYPYTDYPEDSRNVELPDAHCNPTRTYDQCCKEWDRNKDGYPDNFFYAQNGRELEKALRDAITDILKKASSGTAASVVSTRETSGAIVLQALFYPQNPDNPDITWTGSLKNLWFYLGPFAQNIREDTDQNLILNLASDYVIDFFFDNSTNRVKVHVFSDSNGDGIPDTSLSDKYMEDVLYLWDAGKVLFSTDPSNRKIFTNLDNLTEDPVKGNFIVSNAESLKNYLDVENATQAEEVIRYIRGEDLSGFRSRTITINGTSSTWKLGDIVYSTPQVVSDKPINEYHTLYNDDTYRQFYDNMTTRGMVFVGANDGMLHAFRLGKLTMLNPISGNVAKLDKYPATITLGSEAWAFIPKNILPYLKYLMSPEYCHLYYVDLTPFVVDASIGKPGEHESDYYSQTKIGDSNSWRTVLIGGLRFGGACGNNATGTIKPPNDTGNVPEGIGRSSYFAIDITDPENPVVMWEFTDNDLAFTTTGPAIVHIPYINPETHQPDPTKNGYWYAVFASGPDNYDGTTHQSLYLFVVDLKTGALKRKLKLSGSSDTLLGNVMAFAGRMFDSTVDVDLNYSDDAVYFGYTYQDVSGNWKGGVLRLLTHDDSDPSNWTVSKVIEDIGPITGSVKAMVDINKEDLWLFFGEGRFYTPNDDPTSIRRIYGIKDPCNNHRHLSDNCSLITLSDLTDATNNPDLQDYQVPNGWYITLDAATNSTNSERLITDPVPTSAGWVFYTTFTPTSDVCSFGGTTYLWAVKYYSGGGIEGTGTVYIQTSTGAINRISLETAPAEKGGRRYTVGPGVPPPSPSGITPVLPPPPLNKVIHWHEQ